MGDARAGAGDSAARRQRQHGLADRGHRPAEHRAVAGQQVLAVVGVLGIVAGLILVVVGGMASLFAAIMTAGTAFFYLVGGIAALIGVLVGLTAAFLTAYRKSENFRNAIRAAHDQVVRLYREAVLPAAIAIKAAWDKYVAPALAKAWALIDAAGCRGLVVGDAQVSELHCNFLINRGNARAADIENLGEEVRRRVREHSGVELEWEIKRIGTQP